MEMEEIKKHVRVKIKDREPVSMAADFWRFLAGSSLSDELKSSPAGATLTLTAMVGLLAIIIFSLIQTADGKEIVYYRVFF